MMRLLAIAFRNLARAKRRNGLSGGTMALGSAALVLGSGLSDGIARQLTDNLVAVQTGLYEDGWVEIRGDGLSEGQSVVVAS